VTVAYSRPNDPEVTTVATAATAARGERVPATAGLSSDATFGGFAVPALSDARQMVARTTVRDGRKKLPAIYVEDGAGSGSIVAYQGSASEDALGVTGWTFTSFLDPVTARGGAIAFAAKVKAAGHGTHQGVWTDLFSAPLSVRMLMVQGGAVPGLGGELLKSVTSLSLRDDALLVLLKLASGTADGSTVRAKDDTALVRFTAADPATVLLRTGRELNGSAGTTVKSFSVLQPAQGSVGQGRWQSDGFVVAKVTLASGETRIVSIDASGNVTSLLSTEDAPEVAVAGFDPDAHWESFGLPSMGGTGANFAVAAKFRAKTGTVTAKDDSALLSSADGIAWSVVARKGDAISADAGAPAYASFFDPVSNVSGSVAFLATLSGEDVKAGNKTALFAGPSGAVKLTARLGDKVPDDAGVGTGAVWSKFLSIALPDGDGSGVIFLAETKGGDTTPKNKLGLWGVDSQGVLRRLLRTDANRPKIALLNALPGSFGAARSYNASGSVAVLATDAKGVQQLLRVDIP
jgi:hypothetical protein